MCVFRFSNKEGGLRLERGRGGGVMGGVWCCVGVIKELGQIPENTFIIQYVYDLLGGVSPHYKIWKGTVSVDFLMDSTVSY